MTPRQMLLSELLLNASVTGADEKRLSAQAIRIWELFDNGNGGYRAVWTNELRTAAPQYNARLWEVRNWLKDSGLTIDITKKGDNGNCKYQIVELEGSNYERLLKKRGTI